MAETIILGRDAVVRQGRRLEYFTIAWNTVEGLVAVVTGAMAGSISLVGFGIDSFIEVTSGSVLLWRMSVDAEVHRRELQRPGQPFLKLERRLGIGTRIRTHSGRHQSRIPAESAP